MDSEKSIFVQVLNIALLLFWGFMLFEGWLYGCLVIHFAKAHAVPYTLSLTVFMLGLFGVLFGMLFHWRRLRKHAGIAMLLAFVAGSCFGVWEWWTVGRFPVVKQKVEWWDYRPDNEASKLVNVTLPEEYLLDSEKGYPRLDGAYALYPIYAAMGKAMYPKRLAMSIAMNGSDVIYEQLLHKKVDLIFALAPSKKQEEEAEKAGVTYELTPFCLDAFVFYVNARNPVDNLTTEQIKGIYSGRITDWQEVGSPDRTKIIPFQRNEGSGSQTTLQKLMGNTPVMPPLKEDRVGGMGEIINDTANYRNYNAAIGFSFRYYATELLKNNQIKLLSIDGIAPTLENIRSRTYPLVVTAYMVTASPRSGNIQKIVDFLCSPAGQELVEKTGYVPVSAGKEQMKPGR